MPQYPSRRTRTQINNRSTRFWSKRVLSNDERWSNIDADVLNFPEHSPMMWSSLFIRHLLVNVSYHEVTLDHWDRWLKDAEEHHPWKWSNANWIDWIEQGKTPLAYMVVPNDHPRKKLTVPWDSYKASLAALHSIAQNLKEDDQEHLHIVCAWAGQTMAEDDVLRGDAPVWLQQLSNTLDRCIQQNSLTNVKMTNGPVHHIPLNANAHGFLSHWSPNHLNSFIAGYTRYKNPELFKKYMDVVVFKNTQGTHSVNKLPHSRVLELYWQVQSPRDRLQWIDDLIHHKKGSHFTYMRALTSNPAAWLATMAEDGASPGLHARALVYLLKTQQLKHVVHFASSWKSLDRRHLPHLLELASSLSSHLATPEIEQAISSPHHPIAWRFSEKFVWWLGQQVMPEKLEYFSTVQSLGLSDPVQFLLDSCHAQELVDPLDTSELFSLDI